MNETEPRYRDRDWLVEQRLEEQRDSDEIAEMCDVTRSTINEWMRKLDVPKHRYEDRDWLVEQYWQNYRDKDEIAEMCDVTRRTIRAWMKRLDVPRPGSDGYLAKLQETGRPVSAERTLQDCGDHVRMSLLWQAHRGQTIPETTTQWVLPEQNAVVIPLDEDVEDFDPVAVYSEVMDKVNSEP